MTILHVTNGDAVVPELAAALGIAPDEVLVWREILHDGPVPAGLGPDELARVRARHITAVGARNGAEPSEATALAAFRERDARLAAHPRDAEVALWFEDDLYDALLLAQVRTGSRAGPARSRACACRTRRAATCAPRSRRASASSPIRRRVRRTPLTGPTRLARRGGVRAPARGAAGRPHRPHARRTRRSSRPCAAGRCRPSASSPR